MALRGNRMVPSLAFFALPTWLMTVSVLLSEVSAKSVCLFFNVHFFRCGVWGFFIYSRYKSFIKYMLYKHCLPRSWLVFAFSKWGLSRRRSYWFWWGPSTRPSAPGTRRFSNLSGASRQDSQPCVGAGAVGSSPLTGFSPWPCVDSSSAKYTKEASAVSSMWLSPLVLCAVTASPGNLCSADTQLRSSLQESSPGLPFPAPGTFSRKQLEATTGLTSFASHLTASAGFHRLLSNLIHFCLTFQQF